VRGTGKGEKGGGGRSTPFVKGDFFFFPLTFRLKKAMLFLA
jgi:hypothetical protein